jgi:hypothetical protein
VIVVILTMAVGCRDFGRPRPAPQSAPASSQPRTVVPQEPAPVGRPPAPREPDNAPVYLPASLPQEGWVRQEGLRVADAAGLEKLLPASQAVWFDQFRIKSAASCAYVWEGAGYQLLAQVVVFEAHSPDDAYGLMSCQSSSSELLNVGGETRVEHGVELHFHCWQGSAYVHVWSSATEERAVLQTRRLLMHIAGRLPRTDMPALIEAMPRDSAKPGKRWLVRNLSGLRPTIFAHPAGLDLAETSRLLGMGADTLMCIAAYDVPEGRRPNVVWIVQYDGAPAAAESYARYSRRLEEAPPGSPWQSTSVLPPRGSFLVGTWTAEEESIQYLLPRIIELLPAPPEEEPTEAEP